jgi:hypothetical protein
MTLLKSRHWRLSLLALAALGMHAWAQQSTAPVVRSQLKTVEATVTAIDPATREVTLSGPKGPVSFQVGSEARNFDKVHVGDKVQVTYYQGIAAQMSKGGAKASEPATSTFAYPNAGGAKPGGGLGASVTSTVTIEDVDKSTNTVAFRGSDGLVHIIALQSPQMQQFARNLKRGDKVDVTYTESVAVNVQPMGSRSAGAETTTSPR